MDHQPITKRKCFFVDGSAVAPDGGDIELHWKSWGEFPGSQQRWEFRRVAMSMWGYRQKMKPLDICKEQSESWFKIWRFFGVPVGGAWFPSRHAASMRGVQDDSADAEASLSTVALIFLLGFWATKHRHRLVQRRALVVWGVWFEKALDADACDELEPVIAPDAALIMCRKEPAVGEVCPCLRGFLSGAVMAPGFASNPQRRLAWSMSELIKLAVDSECEAAKDWARELVGAAARAVEQGIEARACSDPLKAPEGR